MVSGRMSFAAFFSFFAAGWKERFQFRFCERSSIGVGGSLCCLITGSTMMMTTSVVRGGTYQTVIYRYVCPCRTVE